MVRALEQYECLPTPGRYPKLISRDGRGRSNWIEASDWYGIKSSRHYVEWLGGTDFTIQDLRDAIKSAKKWGCARHRVARDALDYVQ
jgi:hypothetical protein